MADIPQCPNYRERKGCERSELVLAGETDTFYNFICRCCHLFWVWTKPKHKDRARYQNQIEMMQKATELDRQQARRPSVFGAPKGGWTA